MGPLRRTFLAATVAAAFAACDLNPQPLPPGSEGPNAAGEDGEFGMDAGKQTSLDAAAAPPEPQANGDAGDSGDAGDAGDSGDPSDASDAEAG
jgi:hypothetical protein